MSEPESQEARRLRALRVDPPDDGFGAALHRRLVAAGPPQPAGLWARLRAALDGQGRWLWPAFGVVAGVAAFFLMGLLRPPPGTAPAPIASAVTTEVPASKVAVIKLDFSADVAVESADFEVSLPEGLAFWADGEELPQRSFKWTQALSAGENVIPIAVRGQRPGRYRVTARAQVGGEQIEHEVVLQVIEG